ncbi:hypothetical protein [Natrinema sp. 74]|uniref:hypothetical protein n=1 Tax=Natrinema sp. 74 TaxID=3384159 RepID=UPI0038D4EE84
MAAVSAFGSALKTTTPERTYPTLRGHPPRVEIGDELHVPEKFNQTETDIRIKIPETLQNAFIVTPLAYYLNADVISGSRPELTTSSGYRYSIGEEDNIETAIARVLKQIFFLDCVVRTEGSTPLSLYEREAVEDVLEFNPKTVYNQPLAERVETYLDIPYSALQSYLPNWQLKTQLKPSAEYIRFLPFVANDLATVEIQDHSITPPSPTQRVEKAVSDFTRANNDFVRRSWSKDVRGNKTISRTIDPPDLTKISQRWEGIGDTEISSTAPLVAYENNIGRTPKDGPIEIEVICNDSKMVEEMNSVNETYGDREELPFDITIHYELTTSALESVLARDSDFLHYIGHIDEEGFQCSNGKLDAVSIDTVSAKAFLLNACQSHRQGLHLIRAGSIGGIVTLGNIVNSGAVRVGCLIAQLLNLGFPLYAALDIARQKSIVGQQYCMVGDSRTTIAQSETRIPNVCLLDQTDDEITADVIPYISAQMRRGGVFSPYLEPVDLYSIIPNGINDVSVTESQLEEFYREGKFPVLLDGEVRWSNELRSNSV